jgi:hypothetical protein
VRSQTLTPPRLTGPGLTAAHSSSSSTHALLTHRFAFSISLPVIGAPVAAHGRSVSHYPAVLTVALHCAHLMWHALGDTPSQAARAVHPPVLLRLFFC